jgi:hypothetical protein
VLPDDDDLVAGREACLDDDAVAGTRPGVTGVACAVRWPSRSTTV